MKRFYSFICLIVLVVLASCSKNSSYSVSNGSLNLNINGYYETCTSPSISQPSIYVKDNGSWKLAANELPGKGQYYLNGVYHGYGTCDFVACNQIENPVVINLVEYKKTGTKEAQDSAGYMAPVYETVELKGDIKLEFEYFADSKCSNKKIFSKVFSR